MSTQPSPAPGGASTPTHHESSSTISDISLRRTQGSSASSIANRLDRLEKHLENENPILLETVRSFRSLDEVGRSLGLLTDNESFATQVPWWPVISLLGTFSAGKSTFLNGYIGEKIQQSGNQAVDDKFTVICFGSEPTPVTLPGLALNADPRFPFYQIGEEIEAVTEGEGRRVDAYLQLKACNSEVLRGKILIDSPGFDADEQRKSILRITDHIIDLSDLVLVLFDARHPEPGAMQDTLEHLVTGTIHRADSNKFMYILNQIDNTAREDNPEEVFAAWQRALANKGLTAGRFYRIYDKDAALPIEDAALRQRFESKRDEDMAEIRSRMERVEVERCYRLVGMLEKMAQAIERDVVKGLQEAKSAWKQRVLWLDAFVFLPLGALLIYLGLTNGLAFGDSPLAQTIGIVGVIAIVGVAVYLHFLFKSWCARWVARRFDESRSDKAKGSLFAERMAQAFAFNTRPMRSIWRTKPKGWNARATARLAQVREDADQFVQKLNDRFAAPSGSGVAPKE